MQRAALFAGIGDQKEVFVLLDGRVDLRVRHFVDHLHDIADAIRARLINEDDLPEQAVKVLGNSSSSRINTMVTDVVTFSWGVSGQAPELPAVIGMSEEVLKATNTLREFMFKRVYSRQDEEADGARKILKALYFFLLNFPHRMPDEYVYEDDPERGVVDYIAGMTDLFASRMAMAFGLI